MKQWLELAENCLEWLKRAGNGWNRPWFVFFRPLFYFLGKRINEIQQQLNYALVIFNKILLFYASKLISSVFFMICIFCFTCDSYYNCHNPMKAKMLSLKQFSCAKQASMPRDVPRVNNCLGRLWPKINSEFRS